MNREEFIAGSTVEILPRSAAMIDQPCNLSTADRRRAARDILVLIDKIKQGR